MLLEKSELMVFDRHPEYRKKWGNLCFWVRGYYVVTVENVNGGYGKKIYSGTRGKQ